jgi:hypothetical protein
VVANPLDLHGCATYVRLPVSESLMRRPVVVFAVSIVTLTVLLPDAASAFGYKDTGFDAREDKRVDLDIRSTTRKVWASQDGRGWLTIRARSYEPMGDEWFAEARIDSRGGPLTDYRVRLYWVFEEGFCGVRHKRSVNWAEGSLRPFDRHDTWSSCTVPLRLVRPNKEIRWKVFAMTETYEIYEHAPSDHGWYS